MMKDKYFLVIDCKNLFLIDKDQNEIIWGPIDIHEGIKSIKWCKID